MPVIRQPASKPLSISVSDTGTAAAANAARRLGGIYGDIAQLQLAGTRGIGKALGDLGGEVVEYAANREISQGAAEFAQLQATLTQSWNEQARNSDPNDPETAVRFQTDVLEPSLGKFKDAFGTDKGRQFAERHVQQLREHMFAKTRSDMSTLAGEAASLNVRKMTNSLTNMVRADPSSLDLALETMNGGVTAMFESSPNLVGPQATAARMKIVQQATEQVVKSAIMGAIERNPSEGLKMASDPKYAQFVSGAEIGQFEREARTQERLARAERRMMEQDARERQQKQSSEIVKGFIDNLYSDNPTLTIKDIRDAKDKMTLPHFEHMLGMMERRGKPDPISRVSAETAGDLLSKMWRPDGDPDKITTLDPIREAMIGGRLSRADFNFLNEQFDRSSSPDGSKTSRAMNQLEQAVRPFFDKPAGMLAVTDPEAGLKRLTFMRFVAQEMQDARAAGKNPLEVIEKYSGPEGYKHMQPWQSSLQDVMKKQAERLRARPAQQQTSMPPGVPPSAILDPEGHYRWTDPITGKPMVARRRPAPVPASK